MDPILIKVIRTVLKNMLPNLTNSHISRLIRENMRGQMWLYVVSIVAMIVVAATTSLVAWIMQYIIDSMTDPNNRGKVFMVAASVAVIFIVKGIASYVPVSYTHLDVYKRQ